jgi:hypothetical protein
MAQAYAELAATLDAPPPIDTTAELQRLPPIPIELQLEYIASVVGAHLTITPMNNIKLHVRLAHDAVHRPTPPSARALMQDRDALLKDMLDYIDAMFAVFDATPSIADEFTRKTCYCIAWAVINALHDDFAAPSSTPATRAAIIGNMAALLAIPL